MRTQPVAATTLQHDHAKHLDALTGIRAFAAVWVVLYHFQAQLYAIAPAAHQVSRLIGKGYLGVDLFFTLSGFILAYNYLHRLGDRWTLKGHRQFLWLRLARVYPVHLFTLNVFALMVAVGTVVGLSVRAAGLRVTPLAYVENVFLVQGWTNGNLSFNGPAWSVSAEWFAYLLFPLLAPIVFRVRSIPGALALAAACYGILALVWFVFLWDSSAGTAAALLRVELEFLGGCFLYVIHERAARGNWRYAAPVVLIAAIVATRFVSPLHYRAVVIAPVFGLLILAIARGDKSWVSRVLASRPLVWGGTVSYSLYMTHGLVQPVVNKVFPPGELAAHGLIVRAGVGVAIVLLIAAPAVFTYYLVEVPARMRMRRTGRPMVTAAASVR